LKDLYFFIELNFTQIYFLCENDDQVNQLRKDFLTARDNFEEAGDRDFHENDPLRKMAIMQLRDYQQKLEHMPYSMQDIQVVLNAITATVHLGGMLVALGRRECVASGLSSPASRSSGANPPAATTNWWGDMAK